MVCRSANHLATQLSILYLFLKRYSATHFPLIWSEKCRKRKNNVSVYLWLWLSLLQGEPSSAWLWLQCTLACWAFGLKHWQTDPPWTRSSKPEGPDTTCGTEKSKVQHYYCCTKSVVPVKGFYIVSQGALLISAWAVVVIHSSGKNFSGLHFKVTHTHIMWRHGCKWRPGTDCGGSQWRSPRPDEVRSPAIINLLLTQYYCRITWWPQLICLRKDVPAPDIRV